MEKINRSSKELIRELELTKIATFGTDEEAKEAMEELRKIDPSYHWCPDWDFMVICNSDTETSGCLCKSNTIENL